MDLKKFIRSIPDYPKKGILFRDITTLIKDEKAFEETINQIIEKSKKFDFDKIAAIESRGFVFASAVSYILKKPFIMLRKKNKLPAEVHSVDFELEYGTATIEVHKDSINKDDNAPAQSVYTISINVGGELSNGQEITIPKGHFPRIGSKSQRPKQYCLLDSMFCPNTQTFFFLGNFWM